MLVKELREKTIGGLYKELNSVKKELTLLNLNIKLGKVFDLKTKHKLTKQIAKIKTVISEKGVLQKNEEA